MWNDSEIDMEELEARLYGQVYHPTNRDEILTSNPSTAEDLSSKLRKRYFDNDRIPRLSYSSRPIYPIYQKHVNDGSLCFERRENFDLLQASPHFHESLNFCERVGLIPLPNFILNPPVNNIVVVPQPPTQIFNQDLPVDREMLRREKNRNKRREKRKRARGKLKEIIQSKTIFKEHHLTRKAINLEDKKDADKSCEVSKIEVICLSESDSSVCELAETPVPAILVSSDEEVDYKKLSKEDVAEIKNENDVKLMGNNDIDKKQFKAEGNLSIDTSTKTNLDTNKNEIDDTHLKNMEPCTSARDDDIVFVDCYQNEVMTIDCDDSQSVTDVNNSSTSNATSNVAPVISDNTFSTKCTELLETPESTNDFLDSSFNSSQNNLYGVGCNNVSSEKTYLDVCESDSNFSISDFDVPSRSTVFAEPEFDVSSKETFSELNLDSFTNYIGSKASSSVPSILTTHKKTASNALKKFQFKNSTAKNSSDSSSESDYEDKVAIMQNRSKSKQKTNLDSKISSSESDNYIVNDIYESEIENVKNKISLPNLSPITSDEEVSHEENMASNKNLKMKQKKTTERARSSGQKRKSIRGFEEVAGNKKIKQNKKDIQLDEFTVGVQEEIKFFSSSEDEFVEVQLDTENPCSPSSKFDIELLNIENTSTPINQVQKETKKPKKFVDYWTSDMKKFYTESWGHENFSVEEEQRIMSDDVRMWKIIDGDKVHTKLLPKRPRCHRCKEFGHKLNSCTKKIAPPKCILCGASGHLDARCPNQMCTSCGRRSRYSTTYCSRCANSRHLACKICSRHGHTASNCSDLWRRYHLTIKEGPLKQPSSFSLKSVRDRWCSGCASRGHFEFDCDYYNRTHPATDPSICSYEDVYDKYRPREQTNNFSVLSREENDNYGNRSVTHSTQVSPWVFGYQPNVMCNEHSVQNFLETYGLNQNFYRQCPVFQSVPNIFGLQQNLNNIFYSNSNMLSTNQNIFALESYTNRRSSQDTSFVNKGYGNSTSACKVIDQSKVERQKQNELETRILLQNSTRYQKRDFLKLNDSDRHKLLNQEGVNFLKKFSKDSNVKVKIIKRKKKKKTSYWCMMEGSKELLSSAKESIRNFCISGDCLQISGEPFDAMSTFNGKDFNMQVLQLSLVKLDNPNTNWVKVANNLFQKLRKNWKRLKSGGSSNESEKIDEVDNTLKSQYVALNAILLGKLDIEDGARHMKILKEATHHGNLSNEEAVRESYNYIFRNSNKLKVTYGLAIKSLPCHTNLKTEIENLFKSGISICKSNNMQEELSRLKYLYNSVVYCRYSQRKVNMFRKFHDSILQAV